MPKQAALLKGAEPGCEIDIVMSARAEMTMDVSDQPDPDLEARVAAALAARRACEEHETKGMGMQPAERSGNVNEETSVELTQCGIQLKDGIIGYSKTYTIKPAIRLSDGKRVAVKLYNDTTLAAMFPAPVQAQGGRWPKTQRQKDFAAEYAREMNIVVLLYLSAASDMYHPHLLRILAWSAEPGKWVSCELFDANLFKYIHGRPGPWVVDARLFAKVLSPIASAVAFLHGKNFVHKDINSHHVLFLHDFSRVVLSGHNLSKSLSDAGLHISSAKRGECHWMDPECYKRRYCVESDVYSLGVVMGELLTGEQPYNGEMHGRVIKKQKDGVPPFQLSHDIRRRWPRLCQLFSRCTATSGGLNDGEDAMMTDAVNEEDIGLIRPAAQELSDALIVAAQADEAWDQESNVPSGMPTMMDTEGGESNDQSHHYDLRSNMSGAYGSSAVVVDRVYNSHKVKNKRNNYSNCVVQ